MIKKFIYNNSKKKTLVLLHGLYANSGFWLPHLPFFRNYRVIVYNIDYDSLLNEKSLKLDLLSELNEIAIKCEISGVISHSFGTIVADLYFGKINIPLFNICPIAFARRSDSLDFVDYISSRLYLSSIDIEAKLLKVDIFLDLIRDKLLNVGLNLVPNGDLHFIYDYDIRNKIEFNGDHFTIQEAIDKIILDKI